MRVVVFGGGGFRTPLLVRALHQSELPISSVALYDVDPSRLEVMASVLRDVPSVALYTDPAAAALEADLVFSTVRVGGTSERAVDERTALDHGVIGQETTGAGGLAYALRGIPELVRLARFVPESAWLLSMTNPAGIVTEALRPILGDQVVGICDSPSGLVRRAEGTLGLLPGGAIADYIGLNHLGWLRSLVQDGVDHLPRLLHSPTLLANTEEGRLFDPDFLAALGALPNEYLWYWYRHRDALASLRTGPTRGEQVAVTQHEFYAEAQRRPDDADRLWAAANNQRNASYLAEARTTEESRDAVDVAAGGYETVAVAMAEAVFGVRPAATVIANVAASVTGLPEGSVVETVCTAQLGRLDPLPIKPLTTHQLGLMAAVKASEQAIIAAALTSDPAAQRSLAYEAFAVHPLVDSLSAARDLADDALRRAEPYWPSGRA